MDARGLPGFLSSWAGCHGELGLDGVAAEVHFMNGLPWARRVRILVVEDEPGSRNCLCQLLQMRGYDCAGAANGAEALDLARSFRPQAIIMDLAMPVIDGVEATRRLKANDMTRAIPVLALTASTTPEERAQAGRAGVDDFLTKPTNFDQLLLHLQEHLMAKKYKL
jgi:CheY-like chemotaxis protein